MMLLIFQVKPPNVELGNNLVVNQLVALGRNGRPTSLAHRTRHRSRYTSVSPYSPQALRTPTRSRENDFPAIHSPSRSPNHRKIIESQATGIATRRGNSVAIIANTRDGVANECDLLAVGRKSGRDLKPPQAHQRHNLDGR